MKESLDFERIILRCDPDGLLNAPQVRVAPSHAVKKHALNVVLDNLPRWDGNLAFCVVGWLAHVVLFG